MIHFFKRERVCGYCEEGGVSIWMYDGEDGWGDHVPVEEEELTEIEKADEFAATADRSQLALILYSSGSTGQPKGIKLPCSALVGTLLRQREAPISTIASNKPFLVATRMFHFSGFIISVCAASDPGPYSIVFLLRDKVSTSQTSGSGGEAPAISMDYLAEALRKHRPNVAMLAYHHVIQMSKLDWPEMEFLKVLIPAGAWVGSVVEGRIKEKIPGVQVSNVYGSIETGGSVAGSLSQMCCGALYPNTRVKILNMETGELCGPGEVGEICVKNDKLFVGYINADNENIFDEEGFFRMGDAGYYDQEGFLYFSDRIKDLIRVEGENVTPCTVEDVLNSHPGILESGVLGLNDPDGGEYCAALVVLEEDVELDMEEVRDWANRQLRLSANLREVRKVSTLPVNNVGKKVRRNLKELWKSPSAKIKAEPAS